MMLVEHLCSVVKGFDGVGWSYSVPLVLAVGSRRLLRSRNRKESVLPMLYRLNELFTLVATVNDFVSNARSDKGQAERNGRFSCCDTARCGHWSLVK
uniref:Uncharacterized protein n=1 Tax=Hyaloperonospora arabidopsidis (strain Emoy2) TaxID=559515 RepID=M4C6T8_HYAAE